MKELESFFQSSAQTIYWPSELAAIFQKHQSGWKLPREMTFPAFVSWLRQKRKLTQITLTSPRYAEIVRYAWGPHPSPVLVALSTKRASYCSHGSALWIHGLGGSAKDLYVNQEQREKPPNDGNLTQEAIDRVFRRQPRHTKLIYRLSKNKITIVNGKQTGRLGVEKKLAPTGESVVTCLERTLIDVTVRPNYAGGASAVMAAFDAARGISLQKMLRFLKTLDYTYPYHQAIGFYLLRSGYSQEDREPFARLGTDWDFYLCHGLRNPLFDTEWKIYYPRDIR